jgi:hypothetical protein
LAAFDHTHVFVWDFVWNVPGGSRFIGSNKFAKAVADGWERAGVTSVSSGSPSELSLAISGQDAGLRLEGTSTAGNFSGRQPRFFVTADPQNGSTINVAAFSVPGIINIGTYSRAYLRNPWLDNHLSLYKNFHFSGDGKRYLQLRLEAFNVWNHRQASGYNLTTNITNAAGQTGSAIFGNYTGLTVTNNLRPAGSTALQGNYFGEQNNWNPMGVIELAAKFYF